MEKFKKIREIIFDKKDFIFSTISLSEEANANLSLNIINSIIIKLIKLCFVDLCDLQIR